MSKADLSRLVDESRFIFVGTVIRQGATDTHVMVGPEQAVMVRVDDILQSTDVLSRLTGGEVVVASEHAGAMTGTHLLFTNGVVYGDRVVVQEVGHRDPSAETIRDVRGLLKAARERPLLERIAGADLIITGKVIASKPAEKRSIRRSEHDPDWWIARVQVQSVLKGGKTDKEIDVLFAHSMDIAWYKSPKLEEGLSGIFILRHVNANESPPEVGRAIYQAVDPLDFLPIEKLHEVRHAIGEQEEGR